MRLFIFSLFFVVPAFAGNFGVRLTGGAGAYIGGINNNKNRDAADKARIGDGQKSVSDYTKYVSAGWLAPIQLEGTYGLTDKFEVLLGVRYGFSGSLQGDDKYIIDSFGAALGYRYYFNVSDFIQPYMSGQLAIDLTKFTHLEGRSAIGFLFEINKMFGVFVEGTAMVAGLYNSDDTTGKGLQIGAGLGAGLNLRF